MWLNSGAPEGYQFLFHYCHPCQKSCSIYEREKDRIVTMTKENTSVVRRGEDCVLKCTHQIRHPPDRPIVH